MNENENIATETVENDEIEQASNAFDDVWEDAPAADDDFDLSENAEAEEGGSQPEEAAEPEEDADEAAGETAEQQEETAAEEQSEPEPETYTLKFLGQERQVSRDEVIELAEKGSNYDHVKEERDSLRKDKPKFEGYERFLQELAEASGTDIPGLIENTRATMLVQKAKAEGKELSEAAAIEQIRRESREAAAKKPEEPEQKPEESKKASEDAARQENFRKFIAAYPKVKAEDIPQEVWAESFKTGDLAGAYARWENRQLRAENERLKQNQKNKERSTGSRRTAGASTPKDDFDEAWDSV